MDFWSGINLSFLVNVVSRPIVRLREARVCAAAVIAGLWVLATMVFAPIVDAYANETGHAAGVRAVAIDVSGDRNTARLVLTLSAPVEARAFLLERPDRVIIDLPHVTFNLPDDLLVDKKEKRPNALIASFRYGLFAQARSRIVIDLKEPAVATKVLSEPAANGATLTIELTRTDRAAYGRAAMQPMVEAAAALSSTESARIEAVRASADSAATAARDDRPLIMIDPGHGGVDPGAGHSGLHEKDLVLAFAKRFKDQIEQTGRYRVQLTRNDDSFLSLGGRVRIAREAQADLFISVHADSIGGNAQVRGATVYTSSNIPTDAEFAQLAAKENLADQIAGVEAVEETGDVVGILADLTRRETQTLSQFFAERTIDTLRSEVYLNRNPHRSARFMVLKAPDVPSVLLELGYLSSEQDVALLTSNEWQEKTVNALVLALDRFFARRIAGQGQEKG